MTTAQITHHGSGSIYNAENNIIFQSVEGFVAADTPPLRDLAACADDRFVVPGGQWNRARSKLTEDRFVILVGAAGTGRRSAALWLLQERCREVREFTPDWTRPQVSMLYDGPAGHGYLLDLSEPTPEPARPDFGTRLLAWTQNRDSYCVVTVTEETWNDSPWRRASYDAAVRLESPDARLLVERELVASGAGARTGLLSDDAFTHIWNSKPTVREAIRLVQIVLRSGEAPTPAAILDEYDNWESWIEENLPDELDARLLFWSCAFCDGGDRQTIIRMAEDLHTRLGNGRRPVDVLMDKSSSKRLAAAHLRISGRQVRLDPTRHGLAAAVRRHLWAEYAGQLDPIKTWVMSQLVSLSEDESTILADAVSDVMSQFEDDELLRRFRDALVRRPDTRLLRFLSASAVDQNFGAHVRRSLYSWLDGNPRQELVDLVAGICAGPLGDSMPTSALVRLRLVALRARTVTPALSGAFAAVARRSPDLVVAAIESWFENGPSRKAATTAFLALAGTAEGAQVLFGNQAKYFVDVSARGNLIRLLVAAFQDPETTTMTTDIIRSWSNLAATGVLDSRATADLFGAALRADGQRAMIGAFFNTSGEPNLSHFQQQVIMAATHHPADGDTGHDHE